MLVKSVFGWIGLADNTTCPELAQARTVPPSPGEGGVTVRAWGLGSQARAWRHPARPAIPTVYYGYAFLFEVLGIASHFIPF